MVECLRHMSKKIIYILITCIGVNLFTWLVVLPYAQNTANSHINSGPFFSVIYYVVSIIIGLLGIGVLVKQKDIKLLLLLLAFSATLVFWAYTLQSLLCLGCLNNG